MKPLKKAPRRRLLAAVVLAFSANFALSIAVFAQSVDPKAGDQKAGANDKREGITKRIDEIAEVGRLLSGPAANPECVWLGRRVISLLWRDDLDTAFRHLDLYDRFGCPGGHIQATFRCLVRQGDIDPKAPETLNARIHTCWINPSAQPAPASTAAQSPDGGTTTR